MTTHTIPTVAFEAGRQVPPQPVPSPAQPTVPRHQSPIPEITLDIGDWFDFVKVFLARAFALVHINWWPSITKLQLCRDILHEVSKGHQRIVAVVNSKGGAGKTPLAAYFGAICQVAFGLVFLIDANENNGNTAEQLDIDRNTTPVLLRSAVEDPLQIATGSKIDNVVGKHKETNLLCLASDPSSPAGSFTLEEFLRMITTAFECFHSLVADSGNGNANVPNIGLVQAADVLLVPLLADKPGSFGSAVTTLNDYHTLGYADVVRESFLVVNATRRRDTKKRLLAALRKEVIKHILHNEEDAVACDAAMERLGITEDRIFMIPFSRFIKQNSNRTTLNPRDIGIRPLLALHQLAIAVFRLPIATAEEKELRNQQASTIQCDLALQRAQEAARRRGEYIINPAS